MLKSGIVYWMTCSNGLFLRMPQLKFTSLLSRFFPDLSEGEFNGRTIREVLNDIDQKHPGMLHYILDEQYQLRKHVNIFLDGTLIKDRENLDRTIDAKSEIYILQALSGG